MLIVDRLPGRRVDSADEIGEAGRVRSTITQRCRLWLWTLLFAVVASGCASSSGSEPVVVLAASSLTDVLPEIAESFTISSGIPVELSFAGSSTLREQILDGAPASVFISANPAIMAELATLGLIRPDIESVATNAIVLAVPEGNPGQITGLTSLAQEQAVVGLCAVDVPCGQLSQDVLDLAGVEAAVDTFEPSVRSLLGKVEVGEIDAGLVYETDVLSSDSVEAIGEPFLDAGATTYVAATLLGSGSSSERFLEFLGSDEALFEFREDGFGTP